MAKDVVDLKSNDYNQVISIVNKYISSIQAISSDISSARSCLSFSVDFSSATSLVSKITSDYTSFSNLIQSSLDKYAQVGEELNREVLKLDFEELDSSINEKDIDKTEEIEGEKEETVKTEFTEEDLYNKGLRGKDIERILNKEITLEELQKEINKEYLEGNTERFEHLAEASAFNSCYFNKSEIEETKEIATSKLEELKDDDKNGINGIKREKDLYSSVIDNSVFNEETKLYSYKDEDGVEITFDKDGYEDLKKTRDYYEEVLIESEKKKQESIDNIEKIVAGIDELLENPEPFDFTYKNMEELDEKIDELDKKIDTMVDKAFENDYTSNQQQLIYLMENQDMTYEEASNSLIIGYIDKDNNTLHKFGENTYDVDAYQKALFDLNDSMILPSGEKNMTVYDSDGNKYVLTCFSGSYRLEGEDGSVSLTNFSDVVENYTPTQLGETREVNGDNKVAITFADAYDNNSKTEELLSYLDESEDENGKIVHRISPDFYTNEKVSELLYPSVEEQSDSTFDNEELASLIGESEYLKSKKALIKENIDQTVQYAKYDYSLIKTMDGYEEKISADVDKALEITDHQNPIILLGFIPSQWDFMDSGEFRGALLSRMFAGDVTVMPDLQGSSMNVIAKTGHTYSFFGNERELTLSTWQKYFNFGAISDETIKVFNYICNTDGYEAGYEYMKLMCPSIDQEYDDIKRIQDEQFAKSSVWAGALSVLLSPWESMANLGNVITRKMAGQNLLLSDIYSSSSTWHQTISGDLRKNYGDTLGTIYDVLYSVDQSLMNMGVATLMGGSPAAMFLSSYAIMGSNVFNNTLYEAKKKNIPDDQAIMYASACAAIETAMESWSLGHLMGLEDKFAKSLSTTGAITEKISSKIATLPAKVQPVAEKLLQTSYFMLSQGFMEGEEEYWTEIADNVADVLINGDMSEAVTKYNNYKKMHKDCSDFEAAVSVLCEIQKAGTEAFVSGFLSGIIMGPGAHGSTSTQIEEDASTNINAIINNNNNIVTGTNTETSTIDVEGGNGSIDTLNQSVEIVVNKIQNNQKLTLSDLTIIRESMQQQSKDTSDANSKVSALVSERNQFIKDNILPSLPFNTRLKVERRLMFNGDQAIDKILDEVEVDNKTLSSLQEYDEKIRTIKDAVYFSPFNSLKLPSNLSSGTTSGIIQDKNGFNYINGNSINLQFTTNESMEGATIEDLILVHATNYFPSDGEIKSHMDATNGNARNTVHFSLNGRVASHVAGNFDGRSVIILDPVSTHLDQIVGMQTVDTYTLGTTKLSDQAVILLREDAFEKFYNEYKEDIDKMKDRIIVFSGDDVNVTNSVLSMLGYKPQTGGMWSWNNENNNKVVEELFRSNYPDVERSPHDYTIYKTIESKRSNRNYSFMDIRNDPNLDYRSDITITKEEYSKLYDAFIHNSEVRNPTTKDFLVMYGVSFNGDEIHLLGYNDHLELIKSDNVSEEQINRAQELLNNDSNIEEGLGQNDSSIDVRADSLPTSLEGNKKWNNYSLEDFDSKFKKVVKDGVTYYIADGEEFNFLVHVIDTNGNVKPNGSNAETLEKIEYLQRNLAEHPELFTGYGDQLSKILSCSTINNNGMQTFTSALLRDGGQIILGFNEDDVNNVFGYFGSDAGIDRDQNPTHPTESVWKLFEEGSPRTSAFDYDEVVIARKTPSYIISQFEPGDVRNANNIKWAEKYNIPIVYINKDTYIKQYQEKLMPFLEKMENGECLTKEENTIALSLIAATNALSNRQTSINLRLKNLEAYSKNPTKTNADLIYELDNGEFIASRIISSRDSHSIGEYPTYVENDAMDIYIKHHNLDTKYPYISKQVMAEIIWNATLKGQNSNDGPNYSLWMKDLDQLAENMSSLPNGECIDDNIFTSIMSTYRTLNKNGIISEKRMYQFEKQLYEMNLDTFKNNSTKENASKIMGLMGGTTIYDAYIRNALGLKNKTDPIYDVIISHFDLNDKYPNVSRDEIVDTLIKAATIPRNGPNYNFSFNFEMSYLEEQFNKNNDVIDRQATKNKIIEEVPYFEDLMDRFLFIEDSEMDQIKNSETIKINGSNLSVLYLNKILTDDTFFDYALRYISGEQYTFTVATVKEQDLGRTVKYNRADIVKGLEALINSGDIDVTPEMQQRFNSLKDNVSFDKFIESKGNNYDVNIDNGDYSISVGQLVALLKLPTEEFSKICRDSTILDINGIPKEYFAYAAVELFDSNVLNNYLVPDNIIQNIDLIKDSKVIDIEYLNKYLETEDENYKKINIDLGLKQKILSGMPQDATSLEKAIYIYIKMCKALTYDQEYYAVNQRGDAAYKHDNTDYVSTINLNHNDAVCFEFNVIYSKLLNELGINFEADEFVYGGGHNFLRFRSGKVLVVADSVTSILEGDIMQAKLNQPLEGLKCFNKNEDTRNEFDKALNKMYNLIAEQENSTNNQVGHVQTREELLEEYFDTRDRAKVDEIMQNDMSIDDLVGAYSRLSTPVSDVSLNEKFSIIIDKVNSTGFVGIDAFSYVLQLRRTLFDIDQRNNNISYTIIRNNAPFDAGKVAMASAIFVLNEDGFENNPNNNVYYYYNPNHELEILSKEELQKRFDDGTYQYVKNDDPKIPGIN